MSVVDEVFFMVLGILDAGFELVMPVVLATFALAGFANLSSIAIQIGSFGALSPERRGEIAKNGPLALIAGLCTNLLNAAIVGVIAL